MTIGTIFNIQKYAIHDGPGIRTTVFLKGCPLKCGWCHNPESQSIQQEILFSPDKCIGCGDCYKGCIGKAISSIQGQRIKDNNKCSLCGNCAVNCPAEAIEMIGKTMTAEDLMKEIEKDRIFYEESGGGVTFSGGEPLMQLEFLHEVLHRCREVEIHTVLDTSGYSSWETLSKISSHVELFLYDIKHMNDQKHMALTGVSNRPILDNLKKLVAEGKRIWIRVPIIPGINDDDQNIAEIGSLMDSLKLREIYLLPYHNIAMDKYRRLGKTYGLPDIQTPSDRCMNEIAQNLKSCGLNVRIGG